MNSRKFFYILVAIVALINIGGIAAVVYGKKVLNTQSDKLTELKVESGTLEDVQRSLVTAKKDIEQYADIEKISKAVVPQEKDQARTVREIIKLAEESSIKIASVSFPTSSLGAKAAGGAPTPTTTTTQTQKVDGINGVERLEVTVSSNTSNPVRYTDFLAFLQKLEQNRRTSQVSNINIQPVADDRTLLTFSLVLNVYIKK